MATPTKAKPKAASPKPLSAAPAQSEQTKANRRTITGLVVSDKMQKTIVVKIDRRVRHHMYFKYVTKSRRFKAHDEKNESKTGDLVQLVETRPMSKDKRWALQKIVRRAIQTAEVPA